LTPILYRLNIFINAFTHGVPQGIKGKIMIKFGMRGLIGTTALIVALGVSQAAFAEYTGFGEGIPVGSAARQIAPPEFEVKFGAGVDEKAPISWSNAADWQSALSSAVAKKGLKATVSGTTVTIEKASATPKAESSSRPYSSSPSSDMVQKNSKPNPRSDRAQPRDPKPRPAPRAQQEVSIGGGGFTIRPYQQRQLEAAVPEAAHRADQPHSNKTLVGKDIKEGDWKPASKGDGRGQYVVAAGYMLRTTLANWAEGSGWKVVWESEYDYAITTDATFSGDFIEASKQLITAMKDARPTITADFFKANKTVVISNKLADEVN
jgi:hypothetical protein